MISLPLYDTTVLALGSLFLGIVLLIRGGSWTIDSGVFIARRFGISPMVVGFTIIAFGTSFPELVVSVFANLQGSPGITLGNVLGSNIANILLVLGVTAMMATIRVTKSKSLIRDLVFMMFSTVLLIVLLKSGDISRLIGIGMVGVLGAYILFQYKTTKSEEFEADDIEDIEFESDMLAYVSLVLGLICIAVGAEFLVKGARVSAGLMGVPESVIALSIIALGTSLPELSTSMIALRKGQAGLVVGNIIGSNVFNILMIVGFASFIEPIVEGTYAPQILNFDVWITLAVSFMIMMILLVFGRISRVTGSLFFCAYIAYNIYIYVASLGVS